jgi:anaerobic magnesium-protoporphyrin IX monomethyl ester cyclase
MKFALVNPKWSFQGSTYFGCSEPHFPLELLSAREILRKEGNTVLLIDAFMEDLTPREVSERLDAFNEDFLVIPTAPSYLFWRCPQPELRVPTHWIAALGRSSKVVAIGPHGSVTPQMTLYKTQADVVLRGEADQTLPQLASTPWEMIAGCCRRDDTGTFRMAQRLV